MNKDEHKDNSMCMDFMETHGVFMSNAVLSNLAVTIATELESRGRTKDEDKLPQHWFDKLHEPGNAKRAEFMKSAHEIADDLSEILSQEGGYFNEK